MDLFPCPKSSQKIYWQIEDNVNVLTEPFVVDHRVVISFPVMFLNNIEQLFVQWHSEIN